jgi:outer membrane protein TolC
MTKISQNKPFRLQKTLVLIMVMITSFCGTCFSQVENIKTQLDSTDRAIIDSLVVKTFQNSYDMEAMREEYLQEQERIGQEKMSWLGSFRLGIQFLNYEQGSDAQSAQVNFVPALGLTLNLDIEGLFTLPSKVRLAEAGARRVENEIMKKKRTIRIWIEEKYQEYTKILSSLQIMERILSSQEEQTNLALERFKRGEGKIEDYLLGLNGLAQTRQAILESKFRANQIYREIEITSGQLEDLDNLMGRK